MDLFTYVTTGNNIQEVINCRNKYPNNKSFFMNLHKDFITKVLEKIGLLNAGYTYKNNNIRYDAVIYMCNECISFYEMQTTQVISFAFTGCSFALCKMDATFIAFHIPPQKKNDFLEITKELNLKICIQYNPMVLITGGEQINSTLNTPKIWGIINEETRKIYALEVVEYPLNKTGAPFCSNNRFQIREYFRWNAPW